MSDPDALAAIADQAREVGRGWAGPDAEPDWGLVAALFGCVADDPDLLALAAEIPLERLPALLFVASVQRVVADHSDDLLARYYPGPHQRAVDAELPGVLARFATTRADELRPWFDRRYQMNEVGRCAQIALAVGVVQRAAPGRRLAVIDVGTGSGLGLYFDRYRVDLGAAGSFGPSASPVQLACAVSGGTPPLPAPPDVAVRIGIDAAPIDLDDPDSRAWLTACAPPTAAALARLAGAIEVTRAEGAGVVAGDGADALVTALATLPGDVLAIVTDSYTAVFMDDAGRQAMGEAVAGHGGDAVWISLDPLVPLGTAAERGVHGLPLASELVERNRAGGVFALLSVVGRIGGERLGSVLAAAHPSGTRMEWLADEI